MSWPPTPESRCARCGHYHAKGLLAEPERDHSGYRRYPAAAVVELIRIRTLAGHR
ncbi:MerR family transcriptional regulator [Nocardia farcinica]